jgi:hypothetical protein
MVKARDLPVLLLAEGRDNLFLEVRNGKLAISIMIGEPGKQEFLELKRSNVEALARYCAAMARHTQP